MLRGFTADLPVPGFRRDRVTASYVVMDGNSTGPGPVATATGVLSSELVRDLEAQLGEDSQNEGPVLGADGTPPSSPSRIAQTFVDSLTVPLQTAVLHSPPRLRVTRARSSPPQVRRSTRIAATRSFRLANPEMQAQSVLIRKLGLVKPHEPVGVDAVQAYSRSFRGGLPTAKFNALRDLLPGADWRDSMPLAAEGQAVA